MQVINSSTKKTQHLYAVFWTEWRYKCEVVVQWDFVHDVVKPFLGRDKTDKINRANH